MTDQQISEIILPIVKEHGRSISNINETFIAIFRAGLEINRKKAEQWDALDEKIGKFYAGEEDNEEEGIEGDLCDIGEVAAEAFGYL